MTPADEVMSQIITEYLLCEEITKAVSNAGSTMTRYYSFRRRKPEFVKQIDAIGALIADKQWRSNKRYRVNLDSPLYRKPMTL